MLQGFGEKSICEQLCKDEGLRIFSTSKKSRIQKQKKINITLATFVYFVH